MSPLPWHISVLVPARNEEELLPRCLLSIAAACAALPALVTSDVVVGVDSSSDRTCEIAEGILFGYGIAVTTQACAVGRVRSLAAETALQRYAGPLHRCWLANTDADCCVPETWLVDQLTAASRGVEAIAGTIDVDSFCEHRPGVGLHFRGTYSIHPDGSHPHVHGANFGVRADAYRKAGGWSCLECGEDHDLWNRLAKTGTHRLSSSAITVLTSGRRIGRAPNGFADTLAAQNELVA
jgi:cellulose synthase/poly-beta-1,6-N-acetylglucosamine synthase-like glycosyltransferase